MAQMSYLVGRSGLSAIFGDLSRPVKLHRPVATWLAPASPVALNAYLAISMHL